MTVLLHTRLAFALVTFTMLAACSAGSASDQENPSPKTASSRQLPPGFYAPGMGDLMSDLQLRHAKLWYAGRAKNWPLADFELHEIEETFERVARWHPEEEGMPVGPSLQAYMHSGTEALEQGAAQRDTAAFEAAFDQFTQGCNRCHAAMKHEFIVIQRPSTEPVSNQKWSVESH
jgi:hypothetical protein